MKKVYLDNGATTMMDSRVISAMEPYYKERYGNASSIHTIGQVSKDAIEDARTIIAKTINAESEEIIFTSGGTESNNFALKGIAFANRDRGNHIITTKIEHKCVMESSEWLKKQGFNITYLDVDKEGFVDPKNLEKEITDKTILVSVIHGNNEIGTIQNLNTLGNICKKYNVYFHTDACQSYTKVELDMKKQPVDLMTLNAHKIHGPKGIGVLYIRKGTKITAWQHGGGHEFNLRSGTENVPAIIGMAKAAEIALDKKHTEHMKKLRDYLINALLKIKAVRLNGAKGDDRLCNNINVSFRGVEGEAIGGYLNDKGISSSTGSACSEKTLEPSYVLRGIGLDHEEANGSLRLTISRFTTKDEIDYTMKFLPRIIEKLREMSPIEVR